MAKRNRNRGRRDAFDIANSDELLTPSTSPRSGPTILDLEDRRSFTPDVFYRPPKAIRSVVRLAMPHTSKPHIRARSRFSPVIKFKAPQSVLICVRRQRRREVLHAMKKAGKGGMRRPRRNQFSSISCRRK